MARATGTAATELAKSELRAIHLLKADFGSGVVLAHDGVGSFTWGGDVYLGVGEFGSIETVGEDISLRPQSIAFNLTGVDADLVADVITDDYHLRDVFLYLHALDEDNLTIGDAALLWSGYMDSVDIELGERYATIRLNCMDKLADISRARPCYLTDEAQQRRFAGDVGLEFAPQAVRETTVLWNGNPTSGPAGGSDPGDGRGHTQ